MFTPETSTVSCIESKAPKVPADDLNVLEVPAQIYQPEILFPRRLFGKQYRSFQSSWFAKFQWLHYDEINDSVTCFTCRKHARSLQFESKREDAFIKSGFSNWKKALRAFEVHQQSQTHQASQTIEKLAPTGSVHVMEALNENKSYEMKINRGCLVKIIEFCNLLLVKVLHPKEMKTTILTCSSCSNFWEKKIHTCRSEYLRKEHGSISVTTFKTIFFH